MNCMTCKKHIDPKQGAVCIECWAEQEVEKDEAKSKVRALIESSGEKESGGEGKTPRMEILKREDGWWLSIAKPNPFDAVISDLHWIISNRETADFAPIVDIEAAIRLLEAAGKITKKRLCLYTKVELLDIAFDTIRALYDDPPVNAASGQGPQYDAALPDEVKP